MKYLSRLSIVALAFLAVSFTPPGKHRKPTLPPQDPFGQIHWIQSVAYQAVMDSSGNISKGAVMSDEDIHNLYPGAAPVEAWTYDEYGDQLEEDKYHANNQLYNKIVHEYFPDGEVAKITDSGENGIKKTWEYKYKGDTNKSGNTFDSVVYYYENSAKPLCSRALNFYDTEGKLLQTVFFNHDATTPTGLLLYRYNEKGQLIETDESRILNGNRKKLLPTEKNNYWYDEKGKVIDKATYRFREGLVKDIKTTFDSSGYRIITYSYTFNKTLVSTFVKSFFDATHTLQEDTYDANGLLTDYTISHLDSSMHIIDKGLFRIIYGRGKKNDTVMVHHMVYDDHYSMVEEDYFSNDGQTLSHKSYQYTYDSVGNWNSQIEFDNNKPVDIIEREIGYYKD